jgi:cytochrome c
MAARTGFVAEQQARTPVPSKAHAQIARTSTPSIASRPDDSRFVAVSVVPDGELDEPMAFSIAQDGQLYIAERKGGLKVYNPSTGTLKSIAVIQTNHAYVDAAGKPTREAEEGLIGIALDPDFDSNNFIYLRYADPTEPKHVLSRWEIRNDKLVENSRKDLLSFYVQRRQCCHIGGGITFDTHGNLYMTVGANSPDDLSAAAPDDLRGKIIRIHPEADGTYTVPKGNLYASGTPGTRPEIYVMGVRNPWRTVIDSQTGWLYWGEIGDEWDEFNQAKQPGFFGWPYLEGNNTPRQKAADAWPALRSDVPPAQPALIAYDNSPGQIPLLGAGSRCAVGGPLYRSIDFDAAAPRPWPAYFEGKWLITDCVRSWIMAVTISPAGEFQSVERIVPDYHPSTPLDMKFGPDGDLYVLEYGVNFFMRNETARLTKIQYHAGNRSPMARITANRTAGVPPFEVSLSSAGSRDPDDDALKYDWRIEPAGGGPARTFNRRHPVVPFTKPGVYTATLTVTDRMGASASKPLTIVSGNAAPRVSIKVEDSPGFYVQGRPLRYAVHVSDTEDREADEDRVALSINYVPAGFDLDSVRVGERPVDATTRFAVASALMRKTNCRACHNTTTRTIGPAMSEMAAKYRMDDAATLDRLARKVRSGGTGVWGGEQVMPPHPGLTLDEARTIVRAMLSANDSAFRALPLAGTFTPTVPPGELGTGSFVIHAAYTDRGAPGLPQLTSEDIVVLRSPLVMAKDADERRGATASTAFGGFDTGVVTTSNSYLAFKRLDLSHVRELALSISTQSRSSGSGGIGGTVEIRLNSPTGVVLGQTTIERVADQSAGTVTATPGGAYGGIEGGQYDNVGSAASVVARTPTTTVPLRRTQGEHDLFVVFKNARAKRDDVLMTLTAIRFVLDDRRPRENKSPQ